MPGVSRIGDRDNKGDALVEGSSTVFAGNASGSPSFSDIKITLPKEYNVEFAAPLIQSAGRYAALDEPGVIGNTPDSYPPDRIPDTASETPNAEAQIDETIEKQPIPVLGDCPVMEVPDYSFRLSQHFTLGDLSINALFPHEVVAQGGLSVSEIVCNLKALCESILEPVLAEFGPFRINSGFRQGSGSSQHYRGEAFDLQTSSWTFEKHLRVAEWIANNLHPDQCIFEHGRGVWIHTSFSRTKDAQRGELLTMIDEQFESGLSLYY